MQAMAARECVKVSYTNVKTPVLNIQQAKAAGKVKAELLDHIICGDAQGLLSLSSLLTIWLQS